MAPLEIIVHIAGCFLVLGHKATADGNNQTSSVSTTPPAETCTCPPIPPGNKWGAKGYISPVCGTDGVTYNSTCYLSAAIKTSYKTNKPLGLRCHSPCPCNEKIMETTSIHILDCEKRLQQPAKPARTPCNNVRTYCMTDGSEVTRANIYCKMATTLGLGIRCWGPCKECASDANSCLYRGQNIPSYDECTFGN